MPSPITDNRFVFLHPTTGKPLAAGCVETYKADKVTPIQTFSDADGTLNDNPIDLDNDGSAVIFADEDIWLVVRDNCGAQSYAGPASSLATTAALLAVKDESKPPNYNLLVGGGCELPEGTGDVTPAAATLEDSPLRGVRVITTGGTAIFSRKLAADFGVTGCHIEARQIEESSGNGQVDVEYRWRVHSGDAKHVSGTQATLTVLAEHNHATAAQFTAELYRADATDDFNAVTLNASAPSVQQDPDNPSLLTLTFDNAGDTSTGLELRIKASFINPNFVTLALTNFKLERGDATAFISYGERLEQYRLDGEPEITWDAVTGKPATFPPDAHGHPVGDISGLGALATQNTVDAGDVDNGSITNAKLAGGITSGKFSTPVAGTSFKHWESIASGWVSNHGAISFVAQLTGTVTVVAVGSLGTGMVISDNAGTTISSTGTGTTSVNLSVTKGLRYFVLDGTAVNDFEVRTGNDTGIAAVI